MFNKNLISLAILFLLINPIIAGEYTSLISTSAAISSIEVIEKEDIKMNTAAIIQCGMKEADREIKEVEENKLKEIPIPQIVKPIENCQNGQCGQTQKIDKIEKIDKTEEISEQPYQQTSGCANGSCGQSVGFFRRWRGR